VVHGSHLQRKNAIHVKSKAPPNAAARATSGDEQQSSVGRAATAPEVRKG
jgi:hypothetical protein